MSEGNFTVLTQEQEKELKGYLLALVYSSYALGFKAGHPADLKEDDLSSIPNFDPSPLMDKVKEANFRNIPKEVIEKETNKEKTS